MADENSGDLNDTGVEAPGGTQATHSAVTARARLAKVSDNVTENLERVRDMRSDLESEIREHPLKSIAIALGAGYLLAKILD